MVVWEVRQHREAFEHFLPVTSRSEKTNRLIIYFVVVVFLIAVESVENLETRCVTRIFRFERWHVTRGKTMNLKRIKSGKPKLR